MTAIAQFHCKKEEFFHLTEERCVMCSLYCERNFMPNEDYRRNCQNHCPEYFKKMMKAAEAVYSTSTPSTRASFTSTPSTSSPSTIPLTTTSTPNSNVIVMSVFGGIFLAALIAGGIILVKKCLARWQRKRSNLGGTGTAEELAPLEAGDSTGSSSATQGCTSEGRRGTSRAHSSAVTDYTSAPRAPDQNIVPYINMAAGTSDTTSSSMEPGTSVTPVSSATLDTNTTPAFSVTQGDSATPVSIATLPSVSPCASITADSCYADGSLGPNTSPWDSLDDPPNVNLEAECLPHDDIDQSDNERETVDQLYTSNIDVSDPSKGKFSIDSGVPHS